ncbi:hypothetical protein XPA_009315 [Xanthoria parietina]
MPLIAVDRSPRTMSIHSHRNIFSSLPVELRLRIFESSPDLSTAKALAGTCQAAHSIWLAYSASICEHVLPRTVRCYRDVQTLTNAQQKALLREPLSHNRYIRRLLSNAKCAERAWDLFESHYMNYPNFNDNERRRFLHIFYAVWTFTIFYNTPWTSSAATDCLQSLSLQDKYFAYQRIFALTEIWSILEERGQIPDAAGLAEVSKDIQRGSVDQGRREPLRRNLAQVLRTHLNND